MGQTLSPQQKTDEYIPVIDQEVSEEEEEEEGDSNSDSDDDDGRWHDVEYILGALAATRLH